MAVRKERKAGMELGWNALISRVADSIGRPRQTKNKMNTWYRLNLRLRKSCNKEWLKCIFLDPNVPFASKLLHATF
eukprot:6466819-Amphidinium_carterae.2